MFQNIKFSKKKETIIDRYLKNGLQRLNKKGPLQKDSLAQ